ncbi:hypothetical protein [Bacillus marinisedimentorum]|uniref:hypothetical protein n=1 Tax=Bacillus marinisedimentorum TaxID=1821260 RepID=UPI001470C190|nr:hypothetical protein [Bacillus marinisedimentorum]
MSILGFFLTLFIFFIIGKVYSIDWLLVYYSKDASPEKTTIEAGSSWFPILLATVFSYLIWKAGKSKFPDEKSGS